MVEIVAELKDRLNEAIKLRDIKAVELAERTGLTESNISQYRNGYAEPKDENLIKLANVLNVNPSWLKGYNVSMTNAPVKSYEIKKLDVNIESSETKEERMRRIVEQMKINEYVQKYLELSKESRDTIAGMIDLLYERENKQ